MAWYYGTFSCGCEGRTNVTGPSKNRQYIADRRFDGLCPECYEKHLEQERERKNKEAAEKAKEMELPELQGTEKQVAWANTLRQQRIDKMNEMAEESNKDSVKEKFYAALDFMIKTKTSASWYINNRDERTMDLARELYKEIPTEEEKIAEKTEAEVKAEATVAPQEQKHEGVVEIKVTDTEVSAYYQKNDTFRDLVKSLGYSWSDGCWSKTIRETTGTAGERAAELGNKLLNAGFAICIMDEEVRKNAVEGNYEPECSRWIYCRGKGKYEGWFDIDWKEKDDKLYSVARKLPGSKWDSGVMVKVNYYQEVEEFAELYGFRFTQKALKAIEDYKKAQELIKEVDPAEAKEEEKRDGLKEILVSKIGILPDLVDED